MTSTRDTERERKDPRDKKSTEVIPNEFFWEELNGLRTEESSEDDCLEAQAPVQFSSWELDNGISVKYPSSCNVMESYISHTVNDDVQDNVLTTIVLQQNEKIITDIFGIFRKDNDQLLPLPSTGNDNDITISVAKTKISSHLNYNIYLRINEKWGRKKAVVQDDSICCTGGNVDILFVTSQPVIEKVVVTPDGWEYICDQDKSIRLTFPMNCVEQPQEISIQVIPSETDNLKATLEDLPHGDLPCFIGVTNTIHVTHQRKIFKKPIGIRMDLTVLGDFANDMEKYALVDMHMSDGGLSIKLIDEKYQPIQKDGNRIPIFVEVDDFDRHTFGLTYRRRVESRTAKLQAQLVMGLISKCKLLIFIQDRGQNNFSLLIECVEFNRVTETIEKRENCKEDPFNELPRCRSNYIFIPDGERIRVSVSGAIRIPTAFKRDFMFLFFLREGLHKFLKFPVTSTPGKDAYIECHSEKFSKESVHQTYFNPSRWKSNPRTRPKPAVSREVKKDSEPANEPKPNTGRPADKVIDWSTVHRFLSRELAATSWKFPLLAIFSQSGVRDGDKRLKEAEKNNPSNVRDAIYEALKTYTDQLEPQKEPKEIFEAIMAGLQEEKQEVLANDLKSKFPV